MTDKHAPARVVALVIIPLLFSDIDGNAGKPVPLVRSQYLHIGLGLTTAVTYPLRVARFGAAYTATHKLLLLRNLAGRCGPGILGNAAP
ncbi:hypothetical protein TcarDRAFT_0662 [Thermosinus carboxydivorans Nor1]|uniref:Uncharacterized protein n=2 Tax=Thermosinus TaxID=261684 RepID=A1HS73_9FIRM|nr:hypothetical protein TcarDRAFT_0662 [Thermosinus carboxydivorans Nor1]